MLFVCSRSFTHDSVTEFFGHTAHVYKHHHMYRVGQKNRTVLGKFETPVYVDIE